jgi:hypothetical protein
VWCRRPNIWWARRKAVEAINLAGCWCSTRLIAREIEGLILPADQEPGSTGLGQDHIARVVALLESWLMAIMAISGLGCQEQGLMFIVGGMG